MDLVGIWADASGTLWSRIVVSLAVAVVVAVVVTEIVSVVFRLIARRQHWPQQAVGRLRWPFRWLLLAIGAWIGVGGALAGFAGVTEDTRATVDLVANVTVILLAGWFLGAVVSFLVDVLIARYRTDVADNRTARRVRTQALVVRRVGLAAIVVITIASALLVFPQVRGVGASLLASAGVVSIIAGVAAQSTLGNVIAGVQLAFSQAIRVDDVVIANGEWGRIEEITLTYVVVHVWDDRRMVLPSTWFTTTPFENWTRTSSRLMQSVDFDLDWRVELGGMRDAMHGILERTPLWDGRVAVLQVTDAVGGVVHVRILVTAIDAPTLFDLRCFVREEMVRWLQERQPDALPRTRVQVSEGATERAHPRQADPGAREDRELFGGSAAGDRRSRDFTGPIPAPPRPAEH